jgi:hypothetical protein
LLLLLIPPPRKCGRLQYFCIFCGCGAEDITMVGNSEIFLDTIPVELVTCGQIVGIDEGQVGTHVLDFVFATCGTFRAGSDETGAKRAIAADTMVVFVIDGLEMFVG